MSKTWKYNDKYSGGAAPKRGHGSKRRITAKAVRRDDPDLHRMGKALIVFALAEAEAQAERRRHRPVKRDSGPKGGQ